MGKFDINNYEAIIKVRDNITDPKYLEYCIRTDMAFSIKEYLKFCQENPTGLHPKAIQILDFICSYMDGKMRPDKWGWGDSLKKAFSEDSKDLIISNLTNPGGQQDIRKNRFYLAYLVNEWHIPMWEGNKPITISSRKRELPEYMFSMTFYFSKSLKNIYPFLEQFVKDFCKELDTDYGKIIDQSTKDTVFCYTPE